MIMKKIIQNLHKIPIDTKQFSNHFKATKRLASKQNYF